MRRLLLVAALWTSPVCAGPALWTSAGPNGGGLSFLATSAADPAVVYVASGFALYRSSDSGLSWSRRAAGQDLGYIVDLEVPASDANLVYVLASGGLMKSVDGGASFVAASNGLPSAGLVARDLAIRPDDPNTLVLTSSTHGAFRSVDGGSSWAPIGVGVLPGYLSQVAYDPNNPGVLLISPCAPDDGSPYTGAHLYRSSDGGTSFSGVTVSGMDPGVAACTAALTYSPLTPGLVLGSDGAGPFAPFNTVLRSSDGGLSFTRTAAGPANATLPASYRFLGPAPGEVLVGNARGAMLRSTDGGLSFSTAPTPTLPGPSAPLESQWIASKPGDPSIRYFVSRGAGFYRSSDGGASWSQQNTGIGAANIRALAVNPSHPALIYAGQAESEGTAITWPFFRSSDGGASWAQTGSGFRADWLRTLLVDSNTSANPGSTVIYGGGRDIAPQVPLNQRASGVIKSVDGGATWTDLAGFAGLGTAPAVATLGTIRAIVPDRSVLTGSAWSKLYLTASGNGTCSSIGGSVTLSTPRLWRTLDAGTSWNTLSVPGSAAGVGSDGLPTGQCVNGGSTSNPFPAADFPIPVPLVVDHADPNTLYVGTYLRLYNASSSYLPAGPNGVFKSTDGGLSWTLASNGLPLYAGSAQTHHAVLALAMDPSNRNVLYAAANPYFDNSAFAGNVYKTTDGGASWTVAGTGLAGQDIRALLIDPDNTLRIYAASGGSALNPGGVFVSEDGGASWNSISAGLPLTSATALALDSSTPATPTLYAGSRTGVYAYTRVPDGDGDGAPSAPENAAPNGGDGNGDGQPDSQQSQVASLPGTAATLLRVSRPFTLSVTPLSGNCTRLYDVIAVPADTYAADPGMQKPDGAFRFEIADCSSARVELTIHGGSFQPRSLIRAFAARVQGDPLSLGWNTLDASVNGNTLRFTLTDNQPGDARSEVGRLLFQGGPAYEAPLFGDGFE